jgi:hypothetical protein
MGDTRTWWIRQWMIVRALPLDQIETGEITVYDLAEHAVVKMRHETNQVRRSIAETKAQVNKPSPRPRQ